MKTLILHRFGLFSLLKFGFFTGLIVSFPLVSLMMISIWRTAINLLEWLNDYEITIPLRVLLVDEISISAMEVLQGWPPLDYLEAIAGQNGLQVLLFISLGTFLVGVWTALVGFFSGLAFNALAWFTGGLQLSMSERDEVLHPLPKGGLSRNRVISHQHQSSPTPSESSAASHHPYSGPYLEIIYPINQFVPITQMETLIGSSPECTISLVDLQPRHALLSYQEGRYLLQDYSQGKSMVQGHVVDGLNMVKDGFQIQLGPYRMIFRYGV